MTAVDVDALEAARAAAAEWMRTHLFWGLDPSKAPDAADMLLALPEFVALLAAARERDAALEAFDRMNAQRVETERALIDERDALRAAVREVLKEIEPLRGKTEARIRALLAAVDRGGQ